MLWQKPLMTLKTPPQVFDGGVVGREVTLSQRPALTEAIASAISSFIFFVRR